MRKRRKPRRKKRPDWRERNLCQAIHSLPHTRELFELLMSRGREKAAVLFAAKWA